MKTTIIDSDSLNFIKTRLESEIRDFNIQSSQFQKELDALMGHVKPDDHQVKKIVDMDCQCQIERTCRRNFLNLLELSAKEIEI